MDERKHAVASHFETEAFDYDGLISRLIPHYREQRDIMLSLIPFDEATPIKVLDLGAGTGVLSYAILSRFSRAHVVVLDIAENMLAASRVNLAQYIDRVTTVKGDFEDGDIGEGYDLVISGLALHHLSGQALRLFYAKLASAMAPSAVLLNRDIVLGANSRLTAVYERLWRDYIRANGEDDAAWFAKYHAEDTPSSVEDQIAWLGEAGLEDVACHWRYLNFAIIGARKPPLPLAR